MVTLRRRFFFGLVCAGIFGATTRSFAETSISLSLAKPGPTTIPAGVDVTVEVRATFDTRLSAVSFTLAASGSVETCMAGRSASPTTPAGLTYVSPVSQIPFDGQLPHDLVAAPLTEVLFDGDFDGAPGGATDGLPPGVGMLIEEITIRARGVGPLSLSLTKVTAAHTTKPPGGSLFDVMSVGAGVLALTVVPGPGDVNGDGLLTNVDVAAVPSCMLGPGAGSPGAPCDVFDVDAEGADGDVDLKDMAVFMRMFTTRCP